MVIFMAIKDFFIQTTPARRRYGVALFVGVIAGIMSAFVKWGLKFHYRRVLSPAAEMSLTRLIFSYATIWELTQRIRYILSPNR